MAQPTQNSILKVLIAKDIARTISAGTVATQANLAVGEVVVTDLSNVVLDTTTVLGKTKVKVIQGRGTASNKPLRMEVISLNETTSYKGKPFAAKVEQVSYIGYNGSTGSIDVINDNLYQYVFRDTTDELMRSFMGFEQLPYYRSSASATEAEIAVGLIKASLAAFSKQFDVERFVSIELVNNDAGAAITGTVSNFSVTEGSIYVTLDGTVTNVSAGDYIRLGGTGTTSPVYKVESVNSPTSITLDWPYQGSSATIAVANVEVIAAASIAASDFGIKFTGRPRLFGTMTYQYACTRFILGLGSEPGSFGVTTITNSVTPFEGTGVWQKVSEAEWSSWGNEGQYNIIQTPPLIRESDVVDTQNYSLLSIGFLSRTPSDLGDPGIHKGQILIACALDGNVANTFDTNIRGGVTSLVNVLDAFMTQNSLFQPQAFNL